MRSKFLCIVALALLCTASVSLAQQNDGDEDVEFVQKPNFVYSPPNLAASEEILFLETFDDDNASKRWTPSSNPEFKGQWQFGEGSDEFAFQGDKGLIVSSKAQKHAISARLSKPFELKDKPLIVQYQVRLQNGLECGGAYIKLLLADEDRKDDGFSNETPYLIMFGPDRCGSGNQKIHFILRHQNPVSGKWEEKHYNPSIPPRSDRQSHLYTLEIRPDNQVRIYLDGDQITAGSLLENMVPAINPPKEIDDPEDKKPADWVDAKEISDTTAVKPADWDDQPKMIPDPEAIKPEDWDEEADGEWEAPEIPNPEYRGEWTAPLIPNPAYKGEWKPRQIPNPNHFVDEHPHNMPAIDGVGFELWTMNDGITFDNIIITTNKAHADALATQAFRPRHAVEADMEAAKKAAQTKPFNARVEEFVEIAKYAVDFAMQNPVVGASAIAASIGLVGAAVYTICICRNPSTLDKEDDKDSDAEDENENEPNKKKDNKKEKDPAAVVEEKTDGQGAQRRNTAATQSQKDKQ